MAGNLAHLSDSFVTRSGRKVALSIYAAPTDLDKLAHAMHSLQAAMAWDEAGALLATASKKGTVVRVHPAAVAVVSELSE